MTSRLQDDGQDEGHPDGEDIAAIVREENTLIRAELAEIMELLKRQGVIYDKELYLSGHRVTQRSHRDSQRTN
jgi:hypothetical protein